MQTAILVVHMLVAVALVGLVLIQQGKGADMGAAFGSGSSSTVFGARGAASFITRSTAVLATVFFLTSLSLAYFSGQGNVRRSVVDTVAPVTAPADMPAVPGQARDVPAPGQ